MQSTIHDSTDVENPQDMDDSTRALARERKKNALLTAAVLGAWGVPAWHVAKAFGGSEKPKMKCQLPGCKTMHNHNGGYCSALHCKLHQEMRHPKSQRVLDIETALKTSGCPMGKLIEAVGEALIERGEA